MVVITTIKRITGDSMGMVTEKKRRTGPGAVDFGGLVEGLGDLLHAGVIDDHGAADPEDVHQHHGEKGVALVEPIGWGDAQKTQEPVDDAEFLVEHVDPIKSPPPPR